VNMPEATQTTRPTPYASSDDFCRIFNQEMDGFYLLSFLLTADREKAEQCFVSGLEDSMKGNPVFKEWACSWARRAVIRNAVRVINPRPMEGQDRSNSASLNGAAKTPAEEREEIAAVLKLGPFERFVYVLCPPGLRAAGCAFRANSRFAANPTCGETEWPATVKRRLGKSGIA
jgi:hypothetical protein